MFDTTSLNIKKHLLSLLIEKIVVTGNKVDIHFKITGEQFWDKVKQHKDLAIQNTPHQNEMNSPKERLHSDLASDTTNLQKKYTAKKYISSYKDGRSNLPHHIMP